MKFPKYKMNLRMYSSRVYSYETWVAWKEEDILHVLEGFEPEGSKSTQTTSKHINYVADYLGCFPVYAEKY